MMMDHWDWVVKNSEWTIENGDLTTKKLWNWHVKTEMVKKLNLVKPTNKKLGLKIEATEIAEMWTMWGLKGLNPWKYGFDQGNLGLMDWQVDRSRKCWNRVVNHNSLVVAPQLETASSRALTSSSVAIPIIFMSDGDLKNGKSESLDIITLGS